MIDYEGTAATLPKLPKIDHAWIECPHCAHGYKVEWYRKPNMMPPKSFSCKYCHVRSDWGDFTFWTPGVQFPYYPDPCPSAASAEP